MADDHNRHEPPLRDHQDQADNAPNVVPSSDLLASDLLPRETPASDIPPSDLPSSDSLASDTPPNDINHKAHVPADSHKPPRLKTARKGSAAGFLPGVKVTALKMMGLYKENYNTPAAKRFLSLPPAITKGNAKRGAGIITDCYEYAGISRVLAENPWPAAREETDPLWQRAMFSFAWLDDLASQGGYEAAEKARALVVGFIDWSESSGSINPESPAWRPDLTAGRLSRILRRGLFLFNHNPPADLRPRLLAHLSLTASYVMRAPTKGLTPHARLQTLIGSVLASWCLEGFEDRRKTLFAQLENSLAQILLDDGMVVSRSPWRQVELLLELESLKLAFLHAKQDTPEFIDQAITKMTPALRLLRHGDGGLPLFHESREGDCDLIDIAIEKAASNVRAPALLPQGGLARIRAKDLTVFMDIGGPPPDAYLNDYHASPLAIEVSSGPKRLIVNCGAMRLNHHEWRRVSRSSAAHSTIILKDTSALDPNDPDRDFKITHDHVHQDGATWLNAKHNGFESRFGATVERKLYMPPSGTELMGVDEVTPTKHKQGKQAVPFAIRFHIHPDVELVPAGDHIQLVSDDERWHFRVEGAVFAIQDSVYLGGIKAAQPTKQIILESEAAGVPHQVHWVLERQA